MDKVELKAWRERLGLSQQRAAHELGISLRGYQNYEGGRAIPKPIALACITIESETMARSAK